MSPSFIERDFCIDLEDLGDLYHNNFVKAVCLSVDNMRNAKAKFSSLEIQKFSFNIADLIIPPDDKIGYMFRQMFRYAIVRYLEISNLAKESRFHDYLMYNAMAYYIETHHTKVDANRYRAGVIDITEELKKCRRGLKVCTCGFEPIVTIEKGFSFDVCIKISCPHCDERSIHFFQCGRTITADNSLKTICLFRDINTVIDKCINGGEEKCNKSITYKVLETLVKEFYGSMCVTQQLEKYSQLLHMYVMEHRLDEEFKECDSLAYISGLTSKLLQDKQAMKIAIEYLWERNLNEQRCFAN